MPAVRGSRLLSMLMVHLVETQPILFIPGNSKFENDHACLFYIIWCAKLWEKHFIYLSKKCHLVNNFLEFYYWLLKLTNQIITVIELYKTTLFWAHVNDERWVWEVHIPSDLAGQIFWFPFLNDAYIFLVTKWTNKF